MGTGLIRRRKEIVLCSVRRVEIALLASASVCPPAAAALTRLRPTVCSVSLLPERPGALVPQSWCALIRNNSSALQRARARTTPLLLLHHQTERACAWAACVRERVWVCTKRVRFMGECVCVCVWLWLTEWVIQRYHIQLLPAPLTADYCSRHALIKTNTVSPSHPPCKAEVILLCLL